MNPGELKHRIEIYVPYDSADGSGGHTRIFGPASPPIRLWAKIGKSSTHEEFNADQLAAQQRCTFTVRYVPGLDHSMLVVWRSQQYQIVGIHDPDASRRFLELEAQSLALP